MTDRTFGRFRICNSAWLPPFEKNWLFVWGGDEYGNSIFSVRISPTRYLETIVNRRIRRELRPEVAERRMARSIDDFYQGQEAPLPVGVILDKEPRIASGAYRHLGGGPEVPDDSVLGMLIELQGDIGCGMADCGETTMLKSWGECIVRLQKIIDLAERNERSINDLRKIIQKPNPDMDALVEWQAKNIPNVDE